MPALRFWPLGVGDAFSARFYSSCLLLEADGQRLLVDCPHPIRKMLAEASPAEGPAFDLDSVAGVVLTHLHADHASGLEGMGYYSRFLLGRKMPLLTHANVAADLWDGQLAGSMEWCLTGSEAPPLHRTLDDFFTIIPLSETQPTCFGPFALQCRPTIHSLFTIALRIEAAGRCLGYSADTAFDPTLIEWLATADRIVHEASGGYLHTKDEQLAALPAELRQKMRLIHYPDHFDTARSNIAALRQGVMEIV